MFDELITHNAPGGTRDRKRAALVVGALAAALILAVVGGIFALFSFATDSRSEEGPLYGTTTQCDEEPEPGSCQERLRREIGSWAGFTPSSRMTIVSVSDTANLDPMHTATIVLPSGEPSPIGALNDLYGPMEPFPVHSEMVRIFATDGLTNPMRTGNVTGGNSYYASQGTQRDGTIILRLRVSY